MNRTIGLLIALAFSFVMQAFAEDVVENVFSSDGTRALTDLEGWSSGKIPSVEEGVVISGVGVAILSPEMPGYSSYTVRSGATLLVGTERTLSDVTLEAGSKLVVDYAKVRLNYPGYILQSDTLVGGSMRMPPDCPISAITNIVGCIGGSMWIDGLRGKPYGCVTNILEKEVEEKGSVLECQFQNYSNAGDLVDGNYTKGVIVQFHKDSSGYIYANVPDRGAWYLDGLNIGSDLWTGKEQTFAASSDVKGYGVQNIFFDAPIFVGSRRAEVVGNFLSEGDGSAIVEVAEEFVLDVSSAIVENAKIVKTGKGTVVVGNSMPSSLEVADGILVVQPFIEYDMSGVVLGETATVKVILGGEVYTCVERETPEGKKVFSPSFMYTGEGSWSVLNNWNSVELPSSSDTVCVWGNGTVLAIDDADAVMPKEIVVMDGATLKIEVPVDLPPIKLFGTAALVVATDIDWNADEYTFSAVGENVPSLTIASGAKLSVPGGTKFGGIKMNVFGTIAVTNAGDIVFGYAAAKETSPLGLIVDGGTISNEYGNINFACPEKAGSVVAFKGNEWVFKNAVLFTEKNYSYNIGVKNANSNFIVMEFEGTQLTYRNSRSEITGKTRLNFKNAASLYRNNDGAEASLTLSGFAQLVFDETSSLRYGRSNQSGSVGNGRLTVSPDESGYESIILNGSVFDVFHTEGNGNAVLKINGDVTREISYSSWNFSKRPIFKGFKSIVFGKEDSSLRISWGKNYTINGEDWAKSIEISVPFEGPGSVIFDNNRPNAATEVIFKGGVEHSASGLLSCSENVKMTFEGDMIWSGSIVYSDAVLFNVFSGDSQPGTLTVGGLNLQKPLVYRIWEDGNDKINLTGAGLVSNGHEIRVELQGVYEPLPGESFVLGTVPPDFDIRSIVNNNQEWDFILANIEGNESVMELRAVAQDVDFVFNGGNGDKPISDLNDLSGWSCETIPEDQNVTIDGVEVVVAGEIPRFHQITLKNKASLKVVSSVEMPNVVIQSGATLMVGGGACASCHSLKCVKSEDGMLSGLVVEKDATLVVPGETSFSNADISLLGTIATAGEGDLIFGYAEPGETVSFAMTVDGGAISNEFGNINFICPESKGVVTASKPIKFINAVLKTGSKYAHNFGLNNPEDELVVLEFLGTPLLFPSDHYISPAKFFAGGVRLEFYEGSYIYRESAETRAEFHIKEKAQLVFNDTAYFRLGLSKNAENASGGTQLKFDPSDEAVSIVLNNGSVMDVYHDDGKDSAVVEIYGNVTHEKTYSWWNTSDPFINYKAIRIPRDDSVLRFTWAEGYTENKWTGHNTGEGHLRAGRFPQIDNSPITGLGSVVIDSDHTASSKAYTFKTVNTTTGSLSVVPDKNVVLYLDNGFVWAGTVIANGFVYLGNRNANSASVVTIAKLDLQADFPVKVWKDENGNITGNDTLNVGEYINNGGRLVPEMATENGEFVLGDKIVLGEIGDSSPLPRVAKGWTASRKTIDGKSMLVLGKGVGFMVIVR